MMASRSLHCVKAVRFSKDLRSAQNCSGSTSLMSLDSVVVLGNPQFARHVCQLRANATKAMNEGKSLYTCGNFSQHLKKPIYCGSFAGTKIWTCGTQFTRQIWSQGSRTTGHDEDVKVKDGDLNGDDDGYLGVDDGEPTVLSSDEKAQRDSDINILWESMVNSIRAGETVAEIQLYISSGHTFTKEDAFVLISKFRRTNRYLQAAEISDWVVESKLFPWTAYDQGIRLSLKGKLGLSSEVESIFNSSPPELQTEITYNAVIKHFCEKGVVDKSNQWFERLNKSGLITHAFAFNRLLVLYKSKNMVKKFNEVLEAMETSGIAKDIYTYNILMSMKGKQNDVSGIEKVFEESKGDPNVKVDSATYATLAFTYLNAGLIEKAVAALEDGERIGSERTGNVDEVIATLWAKLGKKEKVLSSWEIMKQKEIVGARTYVVMIETFGRLGMVDQAEEIFHEMTQEKGNVRPRQVTALLSAYAKSNMFDKAVVLIEGMDSMDLKRSSALYHHIVVAFLKMGRLDKALEVVRDAISKGREGPQLWSTTMVNLLDAAAEKGDVIIAEKIFDNLIVTYNRKNQKSYNLLLKAYARAGVPAEGFLERMAAAGLHPNKETHVLLEICSGVCTPVSVNLSKSIPESVVPIAS